MSLMRSQRLGPRFGLGLRQPHYSAFLEGGVPVDFVEAITENFMTPGGRPRDVLRRVRALYPVALHGVSMSIGSSQGLDPDYLRQLKALVDEIDPTFVSDHLCWTRAGLGHDGFQTHDLLPLPYTAEALDIVCANISRAQDVLGRSLLIENPSTYVSFADSEMTEWEFLTEITRRTGCELLLDVNNIYVSCKNHGWIPEAYLSGAPLSHVRQIHLAGHTHRRIEERDYLVDTHDQPICDPVWALFAYVMRQLEAPWVMIERDDNIPPLSELLDELAITRQIARQATRVTTLAQGA